MYLMTINNGDDYLILDIQKKEIVLSTKGCIDAYLSGNKDYPWTRTVVEYHVTAKSYKENFNRIFVLDVNKFNEKIPEGIKILL